MTYLTERQFEIANRISIGQLDKQIAASLGIGIRTVQSHLLSAYRRCGISEGNCRVQLAIAFVRGEIQICRRAR